MADGPNLRPDPSEIQAHLSIMQGVIQRMAENSRSCKLWCVTLVSAVLFFVARTGSPEHTLIALVPLLLFLILDTYYLALEPVFRTSYGTFVEKLRAQELNYSDLYVIAPRHVRSSRVALWFWAIWPGLARLARTSCLQLHLGGNRPFFVTGGTIHRVLALGIAGEDSLIYRRVAMIETTSIPPLPTAPQATSPAVRARMRGNKSSNTRPEIILQNAITSLGLDWFNLETSLPGSPDIVFEPERVAVFVHGCFWHRCPYCGPSFPSKNQDYWAAKFARNRSRDRRVAVELRQSGWNVVIVWECKLLKDPKRQARRVHSSMLRGQLK